MFSLPRKKLSIDGHARSIVARKRGNLRGGTKYVSSDEADNERSMRGERERERNGCIDRNGKERERERKRDCVVDPSRKGNPFCRLIR